MHQGQGSTEQVVTYLQMLNGLLLLMTAALGSVQAAMQVCIVLRKTCALCSSLPPLLAQHLEGGIASSAEHLFQSLFFLSFQSARAPQHQVHTQKSAAGSLLFSVFFQSSL